MLHNRRLFRRIYSFCFWTFLVLTCIVMFFGALALFLVFGLFDRKRYIQHIYSCFWAQIFFYVNPLWRLKIEGRGKLPWKGAAVLVSNHESLGDILVLFGLYRPYKWVSKASVFKVPFLGWNMTFNGYVPLVRRNRESVMAMMQMCRAWLARDVPVMIFPEGTRSPDGTVREFKQGAFMLASEMDCPVYPIVLTGTADILPKHGFVLRKLADCRVRVLDPVEPAEFENDPDRLREHIRDLIVREKAAMQAETA